MPEDLLGNIFLNIPGEKRWELPPLILFTPRKEENPETLNKVMEVIEESDFVFMDDISLYNAKANLAQNAWREYLKIIDTWYLGKNIFEWLSECMTTFTADPILKNILRPGLWPYPDYSCLVDMLDKKCSLDEKLKSLVNGNIKISVGMRLSFEQPPPVEYLTHDFLFYLAPKLAQNAYNNWQEKRTVNGLLPSERFCFETAVIN